MPTPKSRWGEKVSSNERSVKSVVLLLSSWFWLNGSLKLPATTWKPPKGL